MTLFEHTDYRSYLRSYLKSLPRKGRGELTKIAAHLRVNTSLLSQILAGTREFTLEQAYDLSRYLGHSELELEYFQLLLQIERAASHSLKKHFQERLERVWAEALKLSKRVAHQKSLSGEERAVFYSSWLYSAIHLFTSLGEKGVSVDEVCTRFRLTKAKASEILGFLTNAGLCEEKNMKFRMRVQSTFVERGSPHLLKHHSNWRVKAIQESETLSDVDLIFTGQMSISREDFLFLRERITELIKTAAARAKDSKAEDLANLNIDWFWIK